jgi:hypothetical protein
LRLDHDGGWTLFHDTTKLDQGAIGDFNADAWHKLGIRFRDRTIEASVDGTSVSRVTYKHRNGGCVSLSSSYHPNLFDNLAIDPG